MPLEANVNSIFDKAADVAAEINQGKGIIVLVDMGSLCTIGQEITSAYRYFKQLQLIK